ncbi:MAG TPA: universal stress protein [Puia sp.]|nr:universal stress protein [Puia sp.]
MKTILIATDFSAASRNATRYGLQLAELLQAKPILFSVWQQVPVLMPDSLMTFVPADNQRTVWTRLHGDARLFAKQNEPPLETLTKQGPIVPAILAAAKETAAGLIIVGMKARGVNSRKLFGSTVTMLAGKSSVPVLVVPEETTFTPIRTIGLAEDVRWDDGRATPQLIQRFMQEFHCRFFLIRVYGKRSGEVIEVLHYASDQGHMIGSFSPLRETRDDGNIVGSLAGFLSEHPLDILVMRPHPRQAPEKWFFRSHTRPMLFAANIPLLILPRESEFSSAPKPDARV